MDRLYVLCLWVEFTTHVFFFTLRLNLRVYCRGCDEPTSANTRANLWYHHVNTPKDRSMQRK